VAKPSVAVGGARGTPGLEVGGGEEDRTAHVAFVLLSGETGQVFVALDDGETLQERHRLLADRHPFSGCASDESHQRREGVGSGEEAADEGELGILVHPVVVKGGLDLAEDREDDPERDRSKAFQVLVEWERGDAHGRRRGVDADVAQWSAALGG
jgi:hypothetical protein